MVIETGRSVKGQRKEQPHLVLVRKGNSALIMGVSTVIHLADEFKKSMVSVSARNGINLSNVANKLEVIENVSVQYVIRIFLPVLSHKSTHAAYIYTRGVSRLGIFRERCNVHTFVRLLFLKKILCAS